MAAGVLLSQDKRTDTGGDCVTQRAGNYKELDAAGGNVAVVKRRFVEEFDELGGEKGMGCQGIYYSEYRRHIEKTRYQPTQPVWHIDSTQ